MMWFYKDNQLIMKNGRPRCILYRNTIWIHIYAFEMVRIPNLGLLKKPLKIWTKNCRHDDEKRMIIKFVRCCEILEIEPGHITIMHPFIVLKRKTWRASSPWWSVQVKYWHICGLGLKCIPRHNASL